MDKKTSVQLTQGAKKRYLATKEGVEHGCCHEAILLDTSKEWPDNRVAEFWDYNEARRVERLMNLFSKMSPSRGKT